MALGPGRSACWAIRSPSGSAGSCGLAGWAVVAPLWRAAGVVSRKALGNQGFERVHGLCRVDQVEHQAVLVGRHGRQGEHLGLPACFKSTTSAPRRACSGPTRMPAMFGSSGLTLATSSRSFGAQVNAFDVHRQPGGVVTKNLLGHQRCLTRW